MNFFPAAAMMPTFSWPMITGSSNGGLEYILTSVPHIPATSTFSSAESSDSSGRGKSRNSVVFGAVRTAAKTRSTNSSSQSLFGIMVMPIYHLRHRPPLPVTARFPRVANAASPSTLGNDGFGNTLRDTIRIRCSQHQRDVLKAGA
ncbi:hypothetical protein [Mycolicibacterium gadium]|uniref:hypothetical protein n=1 Tax=Mycolicibacterium gadium TaxID=1794 RepID=UPI001F27B1E3|nr:hypothetical protein [Mycolicibacterium gadium]